MAPGNYTVYAEMLDAFYDALFSDSVKITIEE